MAMPPRASASPFSRVHDASERVAARGPVRDASERVRAFMPLIVVASSSSSDPRALGEYLSNKHGGVQTSVAAHAELPLRAVRHAVARVGQTLEGG